MWTQLNGNTTLVAAVALAGAAWAGEPSRRLTPASAQTEILRQVRYAVHGDYDPPTAPFRLAVEELYGASVYSLRLRFPTDHGLGSYETQTTIYFNRISSLSMHEQQRLVEFSGRSPVLIETVIQRRSVPSQITARRVEKERHVVSGFFDMKSMRRAWSYIYSPLVGCEMENAETAELSGR